MSYAQKKLRRDMFRRSMHHHVSITFLKTLKIINIGDFLLMQGKIYLKPIHVMPRVNFIDLNLKMQ